MTDGEMTDDGGGVETEETDRDINTTAPGRAWVFGDDIDTDQIIPSRFLVSSDPAELGEHAFNDLRSEFADGVESGDFVVGGHNFGSGSSCEHAPLSLLGADVDGVVAQSFARIFFRNGINLGLPVLICPEADRIDDGDEIAFGSIRAPSSTTRPTNATTRNRSPSFCRRSLTLAASSHIRKRNSTLSSQR